MVTLMTKLFLLPFWVVLTQAKLGDILGSLVLDSECTILAMDNEANLIEELVKAIGLGNVNHGSSPTMVIGGKNGLKLGEIKTHSKCMIGIAYIEQGLEMQKFLLPSYHRQVILLSKNIVNSSKDQNNVHVQKHHHPIVVLEEMESHAEMKLVCKGASKSMLLNLFSYSSVEWSSEPSTEVFDIERQCNQNLPPLFGQNLTASLFGLAPHAYFDYETHHASGIIINLMDVLASYHQFYYEKILADQYLALYHNGSVGGAMGYVMRGEADIFLEQMMDLGYIFGTPTQPLYYVDIKFMEARTILKPAYCNIVFPLDKYSWFCIFASYILTCASHQFIHWRYTSNSTKSTTITIYLMMFGIVFQEYFESKDARNRHPALMGNRFIWVLTSSLLVMAFIGNLKSSLMVNNYYEQTKTIDEVFDKDLTLHANIPLCGLFETTAALSPLSKGLLRLTRKENSQMITMEGDILAKMEQIISEYGGTFLIYTLTFEEKRSSYVKQGKMCPFVLVPEKYSTTPFVAQFQNYDPRVDLFNPTISAMTDSGLIDYMHKKWLPCLGTKEGNNVAKERKLEMKHFYLPIFIMGAGFLLGMISMMVEKWLF